MMLKQLVGSGDRIGLLVLPILVGGVLLNVAFPAPFSVGGPSEALRALSVAVLVVGITIWAWSVALILIHVPRGELITSGPFALVKHPLYTSVAFLVLPWLGFLLDTWLGVVLGAALYVGVRMFAREEEEDLANRFGASWDSYARRVLVPWV